MDWKALVCLAVLLCLLFTTGQAKGKELEMYFGEVAEITAKNIVLREYDYEKDMDANVSFIINSETKFENMTSMIELKPGDYIFIGYEYADGERIAKTIEKEIVNEDIDEYYMEAESLDWEKE